MRNSRSSSIEDAEEAAYMSQVSCTLYGAVVGQPCRNGRGVEYRTSAAGYGWHASRRAAAGLVMPSGGQMLMAMGYGLKGGKHR